jgi:hypothetical protein
MKVLWSLVLLGVVATSPLVDAKTDKPKNSGKERQSSRVRYLKKSSKAQSDDVQLDPTAPVSDLAGPDTGDLDDSLENRVDTPSPSAVLGSLESPTSSPSPWPTLPQDLNEPGSMNPDGDPLENRVETPTPSIFLGSLDPPTSSPSPWSTLPQDLEEETSVGLNTSAIPSDSPSLIPSDSPSLVPSSSPSSLSSQTPSLSDFDAFTSSYIPDPNDPGNSFVCAGESAETLETLDDSTALPVNFSYQLWLDDDSIDVNSVLSDVESAMTKAVADALLTCEGDNGESLRWRRLAQGVRGISASPADTEKEACDTGCHRIDGALTLQTLETTGAENMAVVCDALNVVQDSSTMTRIATSIEGVGAIRYEDSNINCPEVPQDLSDRSSIVAEEDGNALRSADEEPSLGGAATFGIAMGAVIVVLTFLGLARRRRQNLQPEDLTEAGASNKDMLSLQPSLEPCNTMSSFGGGGYTILAETNSLRGPEEEEEEEPDFPMLSKGNEDEPWQDLTGGESGKGASKKISPFFDPTDLPDRLSLQSSEASSEGGFDDDQNSHTLAQYATPIQLSAEKKKKSPASKASSPPDSLQLDTQPQAADEIRERNSLSPPAYPGLSSLLGGASDSDGSTTDEDRSVAQLVYGGARLLKLSDLEAAHDDENSTSSQDDAEAYE